MHVRVLRPAAAGLAAAAVILGAGIVATAPVRAASYPPYPAKLTLKSEFRLKADLIARHFTQSPQLLFFGGSRSQRFDPSFARRVTGLRAANITVSDARPEEAWAMLNWLYSRWPDAKIDFVWGVSAGVIHDFGLDPALLQDPRFYHYFPDDLLAQERAKLPTSVSKMPKEYGFLRNRYSDLGMLLWNVYDARIARGFTLEDGLRGYIRRMLDTGDPLASVPDGRARQYFEQTIQLLNDHGSSPILVLMPDHPRVLRVIRRHHWGNRRREFHEYLDSLGVTLSIKVVDFTSIRSFNGRAEWFYDGVHITRQNADRLILALKRVAGDYLK